MSFNFKKNIVVGVSINREKGIEVVQVDFLSRTVLKYACKPIAYDSIRGEIADMDILKETLQEIFYELQIPKGTEIVLNLPTVLFSVGEFPAAMNQQQIIAKLEEDLSSHPIFQETEASLSTIVLPISTIQFNKVAFTAMSKVMLIEMAMQIKELGYKLVAIDTSVGSALNALIYNERVNSSPDISWVLLFIENNCCRIISMQGRNYVDSFEEKISIGEVLGDEENYSIVTSAITPILKNLPSQCLYVVSQTDLISAKVLADSLTYNAPIIHQESNIHATEPFLAIGPDIDEEAAKSISIEAIGAAIYREWVDFLPLQFNLYNASLGDVYLLEQPPVLPLGSRTLVLSMQNMLVASVIGFLLIAFITLFAVLPINTNISQKEKALKNLELDIALIQKFLNDNKEISANQFDEGDEIRMGLAHNKIVYTFYTIVGTEIPQKLWLTGLNIGKNVVIDGQADNLESVYSFFRNIKDYNLKSDIKLQKLELSNTSRMTTLTDEEAFDTESVVTSANADFYEFRISDSKDEPVSENKKTNKTKGKSNLPKLEPLD